MAELYINRLMRENAEKDAAIEAAQAEVNKIKRYLAGATNDPAKVAKAVERLEKVSERLAV